jgi:hypothetical protein
MPRGMNNFDAAGDGQYFPISQRLVDGNGLHSLVGIEEQPAQHLPNAPGAGLIGRKGPPLYSLQ